MIKAIAKWWNKDKTSLQAELNATKAELAHVIEQHASLELEHAKLKAEHPDMKAEGVLEPWMIVEVSGENTLKGLKVRFDWNEAIIQHMRGKGYEWRNEDVMMQHFIAQLYEHVIQGLEDRMIDDSDLHKQNEFE